MIGAFDCLEKDVPRQQPSFTLRVPREWAKALTPHASLTGSRAAAARTGPANCLFGDGGVSRHSIHRLRPFPLRAAWMGQDRSEPAVCCHGDLGGPLARRNSDSRSDLTAGFRPQAVGSTFLESLSSGSKTLIDHSISLSAARRDDICLTRNPAISGQARLHDHLVTSTGFVLR